MWSKLIKHKRMTIIGWVQSIIVVSRRRLTLSDNHKSLVDHSRTYIKACVFVKEILLLIITKFYDLKVYRDLSRFANFVVQIKNETEKKRMNTLTRRSRLGHQDDNDDDEECSMFMSCTYSLRDNRLNNRYKWSDVFLYTRMDYGMDMLCGSS